MTWASPSPIAVEHLDPLEVTVRPQVSWWCDIRSNHLQTNVVSLWLWTEGHLCRLETTEDRGLYLEAIPRLLATWRMLDLQGWLVGSCPLRSSVSRIGSSLAHHSGGAWLLVGGGEPCRKPSKSPVVYHQSAGSCLVLSKVVDSDNELWLTLPVLPEAMLEVWEYVVPFKELHSWWHELDKMCHICVKITYFNIISI